MCQIAQGDSGCPALAYLAQKPRATFTKMDCRSSWVVIVNVLHICVLLMVEELKKMQHPIPKQLEVNSQVREQEAHASTEIVKLRQSETLPPPLLQLRQALTVQIQWPR